MGLDKKEQSSRTGLVKFYHDTKELLKKIGSQAWQILQYGRVIRGDPTTEAMEQLATNTMVDTRQKNYAATVTVADKDRVLRCEDR